MIASTSGRCVVVDLDDTLYDEIDFVRSGYEAVTALVRERFGFDCTAILAHRLETRAFAGAIDEVARAGSLPNEALASIIDAYRTHMPVIRPREGALELVTAAKSHDGVVACITDGRSITQRNKIAALGLAGILHPLVISEETGYAKPDPHNFREVMRFVGAADYWYVADNPSKDFVAPNALGWTTVDAGSPRGIYRRNAESFPPSHQPRHRATLAGALALLTG